MFLVVRTFGLFPTKRHNRVQFVTLQRFYLSRVCHDAKIEPNLQPLSGELLQYQTANVSDETRLDLKAGAFGDSYWFQRAFFDVRVFNYTTCIGPNL